MQHKTPSKKAIFGNNCTGNALLIILVIIALLAALTAVAMRSTSRSSGNMDSETARIQAEKLMRQAKSIESGINKMVTVNQCSENDVNFVNTTTTRVYTNANSPTDKRCDLFDLAGAGLTYSAPITNALDSTKSASSDFGQWVFTGGRCVLEIGSDDNGACTNSEVALMAIVPHVNLQTCLAVNDLIGITNPSGVPPTETFDHNSATFTGSYIAATDPELGEGATGEPLKKHSTGCLKNNSGAWNNSYIFYHILIAR